MGMIWDIINLASDLKIKSLAIVTESDTLLFPLKQFSIAFRDTVIVVKQEDSNKIFIIPENKIVYVVLTYEESEEKENTKKILQELGIETV